MQGNWILTAVLCALSFFGGWVTGGGKFPPPPDSILAPETSKALIVMVHDGDGVPDYAEKAMNDLRASGRQVRLVPVFVANGLNQPPKEVAPAMEPAKAVGLPALVLLSGGKAIKQSKLPATTEAILEAVK